MGIVGKTLIRNGSEKLKEYFLPRIIRGEVEFAIGYSEPGAGSDAANMQLKAVRDPERGGWVLNGQKVWTTSAHFADWYWLGARTDPDAKKQLGITLFLIRMDTPGLEVSPTYTIGDERSNDVFFNDVFVPDDQLVGELNHGWTYICEALDMLGPEGQLKPDEEGAPMNGRFERSYRYTVVDTLGGGASEIQKNIIARRGLGLPPTY